MSVETDPLRVLVMHLPRPAALLGGSPNWQIEHANNQWRNALSTPGGVPAEAALVRLAQLSALTRTARHVALHVGKIRYRAEMVPVPLGGPETGIVFADLRRPVGPVEEFRRDQAEIDVMPQLVARFGRDLRLTTVNRAVLEVSGLEPNQIIGRTNSELGYPDDLVTLWDEAYRKVFETGDMTEMTYDLPTVDGPHRYRTVIVPRFDVTGNLVEVTAVSEDLRKVPPRYEHSVPRLSSLFAPETASAAQARADIRRHAIGVGAQQIADAAEIVVSELVANAVEHGTSDPIEVSAERLDGTYLLAVSQKGNSGSMPAREDWTMPGPSSPRGRGLPIVAALTDWAEVRNDDRVEVRCLISINWV